MARQSLETYQIPCVKGGLNHSPNIDNIPPEATIHPTRNIILHNGGREKRGGTSVIKDLTSNPNPLGNNPKILGGFDYVYGGSSHIVVGTSDDTDGKLLEDGTVIKSGLQKEQHYDFTLLNDGLYVCNGYDIPGIITSDGYSSMQKTITASDISFTAATSTITSTAGAFLTHPNKFVAGTSIEIESELVNNVPVSENDGTYKIVSVTANDIVVEGSLVDEAVGTEITITTKIPDDWSGNGVAPSQMLVHGKGASERMWACGVGIQNKTIYVSGLNSGGEPNFGEDLTTIYIETGDDFGIRGLSEWGDRLFAFSKRHIYVINDEDPDILNWGYQQAQFAGGAINHRVIINTPNDIICMTEDVNIYSVATAQQYGDYKAASLTRPSFIDRWIKDNVDMSRIDDFHGIYDNEMRAVIFFVVGKGSATINTALTYFIDRGAVEGWAVHNNEDFDSGFDAGCSFRYEEPGEVYRIYTGDYSGRLWSINDPTHNDNGNGYWAGFRTPSLHFGQANMSKQFRTGEVLSQSVGSALLDVSVWVDGVMKKNTTASMLGSGASIGDFILDSSPYELSDVSFDSATKKITTVGGDFETAGLGGIEIQMTISGSASNDGTYTINPDLSNATELVVFEDLTTEVAGNTVIFEAVVTGADVLGSTEILDSKFFLGYVGRRIQFEISNSTADQDFFVSHLKCNFKFISKRPSEGER